MPGPVSDPLLPLVDLPGVLDAANEARSKVDRLLGHRVLRNRSAEISSESLLRGARASAQLDGAAYQLEAVRSGSIDDPVLVGAIRVSAALGRISDTWEYAPMQALAALHLQAARGLSADEDLGRPVGGPAVVARLQQLSEVILAERSREVPGVVVAAVVHGELLRVQPFSHANGVVARAAQRIVLVSMGVDPKSLVVPEVGHVEEEREYFAALEGFCSGTEDGLTRWLVHCANAVGFGAQESLAICQAVLRG